MRAFILASVLALAACGQNSGAPPAETSAPPTTSTLFRYGGGEAPIFVDAANPYTTSPPLTWFICDSIDGPDIFIASQPDEGGAFQIAHYDRVTQQAQRMSVRTSGDLFAAPNGPAQSFTDADGVAGVIYTLDPARMSSPDAATTTPVIGMDLAGEEFECRWFEHMLFFGITGPQSVVVRRTPNAGIELMTFAFDSEGALMVEMEHGEQSTIADIVAQNGIEGIGAPETDMINWRFDRVPDGNAYRVYTAPDTPSVFETLRDGEIQHSDEFRAYALARREP